MDKQCKTCNKLFRVAKWRCEKAQFCSKVCYWGFSKLNPPEYKTCTECKRWLHIRNFNKSRWGPANRKSKCKGCTRIQFHKWRKENLAEERERFKTYYSGLEKTAEYYYKTLKRNAKYKNKPFTITLAEYKILWEEDCVYCGDKVKTSGLDRVDSKLGYNIDNVVRCCEQCNRAKNTMSPGQFIEFCTKILKHNGINCSPENNSIR